MWYFMKITLKYKKQCLKPLAEWSYSYQLESWVGNNKNNGILPASIFQQGKIRYLSTLLNEGRQTTYCKIYLS